MTDTATAPFMAPDVTDVRTTMKVDVAGNKETSVEAKALALILLNEHFEANTWGTTGTPAMLRKLVGIIERADTEGIPMDVAAQRVLVGCSDYSLLMLRDGLWAIEDVDERARHIAELAAHHPRKERVGYLAGYFDGVIKSSRMDVDAYDEWANGLRERERLKKRASA